MRFITLSTCIISALGAGIVSQGDGLLNSYIRSAEIISPSTKGYLAKFVGDLDNPEVPFTPEDYQKIFSSINNPQSLKNLLVDHVVDFDLDGLSVSPDESEKALVTLADLLKDAVSNKIKSSLNYKTYLPTPEDATMRIRQALDRLDATEDLEEKLYMKASERLDSKPNLPENIALLSQWIPDVFETDVLNYLTFFFKEADSYKPNVAFILRKVFHNIQKEYSIFPEEYYMKLVAATPKPEPIPDPTEPEVESESSGYGYDQ